MTDARLETSPKGSLKSTARSNVARRYLDHVSTPPVAVNAGSITAKAKDEIEEEVRKLSASFRTKDDDGSDAPPSMLPSPGSGTSPKSVRTPSREDESKLRHRTATNPLNLQSPRLVPARVPPVSAADRIRLSSWKTWSKGRILPQCAPNAREALKLGVISGLPLLKAKHHMVVVFVVCVFFVSVSFVVGVFGPRARSSVTTVSRGVGTTAPEAAVDDALREISASVGRPALAIEPSVEPLPTAGGSAFSREGAASSNASVEASRLLKSGLKSLDLSKCRQASEEFSRALGLLAGPIGERSTTNFSVAVLKEQHGIDDSDLAIYGDLRNALEQNLGFALVCYRRYDEGAAVLHRLMGHDLRGIRPCIVNALGVARFYSHDYQGARDAFEAATDSDAQNPILWNNLGAANMVLGRVTEADSAMFYAIEQSDPSGDVERHFRVEEFHRAIFQQNVRRLSEWTLPTNSSQAEERELPRVELWWTELQEDVDENTPWESDDADFGKKDDDHSIVPSPGADANNMSDVSFAAHSGLGSRELLERGLEKLNFSKCWEAERIFSTALNLLPSDRSDGAHEEASAMVDERSDEQGPLLRRTLEQNLGFALVCSSRYSEGASLLERAALRDKLATGQSCLVNALGFARFHQQDYKGACDAFEVGTQVDPFNPIIWNNLGAARMMDGDILGADAALYAAMEQSEPDDAGTERQFRVEAYHIHIFRENIQLLVPWAAAYAGDKDQAEGAHVPRVEMWWTEYREDTDNGSSSLKPYGATR